eukprot:TRINITY_DN37266_c0_g1_i1.p1 TRINITY_DN37266_c0_g1~~TRINITY_DN37266_c0_g1_i1.p1  ORF type:complete len:407 (+),score=48.87 TRINITY_DN37266_c0_g1_i1:65-1222(+)
MNITRVQARLFSDLRPSGWNVHRWPSIDDSKTYPDSATARYLKSLVNNDMGAILSTLNRVRFAGHEVGVISYNTMLKVLAKKPAGDRTAKMIMQQMRSHGIGCDSETYELLVKIFHKAGCREAVEQLLKEMRGKDFPVTEASLSTELHVAITEDQRDAIVRKATKTMTNPVMVMQRAVLSSSSFNEAIRRMRDIEEFAPGAELTLENFTKLIHFCKGNTKASNELFLASKEAGLEPDVVLWTALLNSHRLALDFTGFIDAFKSMTVLPNAYTLTVFIHALVAAPLSAHVKVQVGVSIWKLALPLDPTFHLHTAMARLYNQVNCTDGAKSLIRFLKESGAKVPRIIEELVLETETNTTRKKQTSISEVRILPGYKEVLSSISHAQR